MKLRLAVLFLIVFGQIPYLQAQEQRTDKDSLYSETIKQVLTIQVVYPKNYDLISTPQTQYELLYCLDGIPSALKLETAFLQSEGFIPENIIMVGIPNISVNGISKREYDLSPTTTGANTGGAPRFLQFLKNELIPYMQKKLNAKPSGHTLYGASPWPVFLPFILF